MNTVLICCVSLLFGTQRELGAVVIAMSWLRVDLCKRFSPTKGVLFVVPLHWLKRLKDAWGKLPIGPQSPARVRILDEYETKRREPEEFGLFYVGNG